MKKKLTRNQSLVLAAVKALIQQTGKPPTLKEIKEYINKRDLLKVSSLNSIVQYLKVLEEKGYIKKFSRIRGIKILKNDDDKLVEIPLFGQADCGEALSFATDCIEGYVPISIKYIKNGKGNYFFIKASGDSMNKSGINDGDLVLAKKIEGEPQENQIVVAVINGLGTIKKFKKVDGIPVLLPNSTSPKHQPIILHPDDQIYIAGEVIKVFNFSAMEDGN